MTKLEEEIRQCIDERSNGLFDQEKELITKAAAEVAKK